MPLPQVHAMACLRLSLVALLVGCSSTPDVERAWSQCLAFGGSPKFMVAGELRQAECNRRVAPGAALPNIE